MKRNLSLVAALLLGVFVVVGLTAGVRHRPAFYRGVSDWFNLYPNNSSYCWQDGDTLFASATACTLVVVPTTGKDSLFTATHVDLWVTQPATVTPDSEVEVVFFGKFSYSSQNYITGEGWSGDRVIDSLYVITDSCRVRYSLEGHGEW